MPEDVGQEGANATIDLALAQLLWKIAPSTFEGLGWWLGRPIGRMFVNAWPHAHGYMYTNIWHLAIRYTLYAHMCIYNI